MNTPNYKSVCCNADVETQGIGDFDDKDKMVTMYYVCDKCDKPCDIKEEKKIKIVKFPAKKVRFKCDKHGYQPVVTADKKGSAECKKCFEEKEMNNIKQMIIDEVVRMVEEISNKRFEETQNSRSSDYDSMRHVEDVCEQDKGFFEATKIIIKELKQ